MPDQDVTVAATWEVSARVYGHSLTLEGTIGVNAYLILGDDIKAHPSDYQVEFWRDGASAPASAKKVSEGKERTEKGYDLRGFAVTAVAKEMDVEFTMKIRGPGGTYVDFAGADGALVRGDEGLRYSVSDYLDDMSQHGGTDELRRLCKDMRTYGKYAKHYFGKRDGAGSGEDRPEIAGFEPLSKDALNEFEPSLPPSEIAHFKYVGSTLVLEEGTRFRLYFTSDEPKKIVASYRVSGTQDTPAKLDIEEGSGGFSKYHYVEVPNIAAKQLGDMYEFTFTNEKVQIATIEHGPYAYVRWAVGTTGEDDNAVNLKYVASALYRYGEAAEAYFATQQQ